MLMYYFFNYLPRSKLLQCDPWRLILVDHCKHCVVECCCCCCYCLVAKGYSYPCKYCAKWHMLLLIWKNTHTHTNCNESKILNKKKNPLIDFYQCFKFYNTGPIRNVSYGQHLSLCTRMTTRATTTAAMVITIH